MIADRLNKGIARTTINRQRACLSKMMNSAIQWGYMPGPNPTKAVQKFRESTGRSRWLTSGEFDRLYQAAADPLKIILVVAVMTGGRLTEILRLKWSDIEFDAGVIYFRRENTKSGKGRQVPLSDDARLVLQRIWNPKNDFGRGFLYNNHSIVGVQTAFTKARRDAGLKDVCFHTLRHTFASWYMMNGGDLYRLKELLGQSTITLTERYSHLSPDYIKSAVQFFGPPKTNATVKSEQNDDRGNSAPAMASRESQSLS